MQDGPELNIALQAWPVTGWCDIYRKSHRKYRMFWWKLGDTKILVDARIPATPVDRESIFTIHMGFIHSRWLHSWIFLHQQYQPENQLLWRQGQRTNIVSLQLSHSLSVYHHKVCFESDIYNFWILIPQIPKKKQTFLWLQESNFEALGLLAECGKAIREFWQNSGMSLQQFRRRTGVGVGWYRMGWG